MFSTSTDPRQGLPTELSDLPPYMRLTYPLFQGKEDPTSSLSNMHIIWPSAGYTFIEDNNTVTYSLQSHEYRHLSDTQLLNSIFKISLQKRIHEIHQLEDGWDGYKALPLKTDTKRFALFLLDNVFKLLTNQISFVNKFEIFPSADGGFQFEIRIINKEIEIEYQPEFPLFEVLFIDIIGEKEVYREENVKFENLPILINWLLTQDVQI